ncbi:MAG: hypothetical protein A2092_04100 [Rhodobacteraceae bacterium GWE1_64_9]|nr:MAG: hypothetical protein A2092_04100 [Rhodobacteraceae bacterium GWE1_64_9]OHC48064.1 MAG: hypothetical protein A2X69_01285 [Rhodobacteraceae bacterium GWF1_65_7]HBU16524.1 hypothetical protein [Gemmobacter sp.]
MLIKIITLFLVLMAAGGVYYKFRSRGGAGRLAKSPSCPKCGRHRIGSGPCPCGQPRKKG